MFLQFLPKYSKGRLNVLEDVKTNQKRLKN